MRKNRAIFLILLGAIIICLASCGNIDDTANANGNEVIYDDFYEDAIEVDDIPSGFVHLPKGGVDLGNGLTWWAFEKLIIFDDAKEDAIYSTRFSNSEFIVKYEGEYYVNEKKLFELIEIAGEAK